MEHVEKHFTTTAYVVRAHTGKQQVLLIYHLKFNKWLPPGGHLEVNETPPEGVRREVMEETGLEIELISEDHLTISCWNASSFERPYLCLLEHIPPHGSSPAHQHMDLIYLARPCGGKELQEEIDKGHLRWFSLDEVEALKDDEQIFGETKQIIRKLLSSTSS